MNNKGLQEVSIRLIKERKLASDKHVKTPEEAIVVLQELLNDMDRECVVVLNLQADMRPINFCIASVGAVQTSLANPADIFKSSILSNAPNIMLMHNHPSGNIQPSENDIRITEQIKKGCDILGIHMVDHIIVGSNTREFYSFSREEALQKQREMSPFMGNVRKLNMKCL